MTAHKCTQEGRILKLEDESRNTAVDLGKLLVRFDSLIWILKIISVLIGGSMLTAMGFLITYWVKGG